MSLTVLLGGDPAASPPVAGADITAFTDFGATQQVTFTLPLRGQRGTCTFQVNAQTTTAGTVTLSGTFTANPVDGSTFSTGPNAGDTYTFKNSPSGIWDVQIGASIAATVANLAASMNGVPNPLSKSGYYSASASGNALDLTVTYSGSVPPIVCAYVTFTTSGGTSTPTVGQYIQIFDNGDIRWTGTVDSVVTKSMMGAPGAAGTIPGTFYTVNGVSEEQRLDKRMFTGSYPAGTLPGDIVRTGAIADIIASEGITLGTIEDGVALNADLTYVNGRISDILTTLCGYSQGPVLSAIGTAYIWGIFNGVLYFQEATETDAPFDVDDKAMLITPQQPQNTFDRSTYRNVQHVQIATTNLQPSTQSFTGDGVTDSFTLQFPISVILSITLTAPTAQQASLSGALTGVPSDGDTFSWGTAPGQTYTFRATPTATWDVQIGPDALSSATNLVNAINGVGGTFLSAAGEFTAALSLSGGDPIITFTVTVPGTYVPTITVNCSVWTWANAGSIITGNFATNPSDGDTVSFFGGPQIGGSPVGPVYTFRNTPVDPLDVQIGGTAADSVANLVAAINGTVNPATAAVGLVVAANSGSEVTFTLVGPGVIVTVTSLGWVAGAESGPGVAGGSVSQTFSEQDAAGASDPMWTYIAGQATVTQTANQTPPVTGSILTIVYQPVGFGNITVANPQEIMNRAAIEGGSGIYENAVNRPDLLTVAAGLQAAYALLNAYDSIAQTVQFWTYESGLLPGQILQLSSTRLNLNAPFLIQAIQGIFEKTNDPGNHFRYLVTCVIQPLSKTYVDIFTKLAPQTLGNSTANTGSGIGVTSPSGTANTVAWAVNFGLDSDTVVGDGTNAASKYAPVTADGAALGGFVTVVGLPNAEDTFDVLASTDGGGSWNSIFSGSQKITIPASGTQGSSSVVALTGGFNNAVNLPAGTILRLDILVGNNGAANMVFWLFGGTAGSSGNTPSGQTGGSSAMQAGSGAI